MASELHPVFLLSLVLLAASRLIELGISRGRVDKLPTADKAKKDWNYLAMVLVHSLLFILPPLELALFTRLFNWTLAAPMLALLLLATILRLWVIRTLGPSWNTRGLVDEQTVVITSGPYRWIRHPNYLGVISEFISLPLIQGAWISALLLSIANGLVLLGRIPREESELSQLPAWRDAFSKKARLVPGLI
jgi:methyltransferase